MEMSIQRSPTRDRVLNETGKYITKVKDAIEILTIQKGSYNGNHELKSREVGEDHPLVGKT